MTKIKHIVFLTNIVPYYRLDFFRRISKKRQLTIYSFNNLRQITLSPVPSDELPHINNRKLNYFYLYGLYLFLIPARDCLQILKSADYIVFDGNMRHIGYVVFSLIALILRKKCIIWSCDNHRRSSSLFSSVTRFIRLSYWSLFYTYLLYSELDDKSLKKSPFSKAFASAKVIGNGLSMPSLEISSNPQAFLPDRIKRLQSDYIISIGRFYAGRYIDILEVTLDWLSDHSECHWIIIGDGPQKDECIQKAQKHPARNRVHFLGSISSEGDLFPLISSALFVLHSGTVGLHVLDAYRFNKRILIPRSTCLYSVEATYCIEPDHLRYDTDSLYKLLSLYYTTRSTQDYFQIAQKNSTKTMASNLLGHLS